MRLVPLLAPFSRMHAHLRAHAADMSAGVTTLVALALPVILGATGLAFDLNRGYQQRVINQRAADMAALGAALAYKDAGDQAAVLAATARDIARANGLAGATVSTALVAHPTEAGAQAVRVTVSERVPVTLGRALGLTGSFAVSARAVASLASGSTSAFAAPCYLALSSGADAISVNGGASIESPGCAVAAVGRVSNRGQLIRASDIISGAGDIHLDYGTLAANSLRFAGQLDKPAWNSNVPAADKWKKETTAFSDPWANDAGRVAAMGLLGDHVPIPALSNPPTPGGGNWNFNWNPSSPVSAWRQGTSGDYVVPAGVYNIGQLQVEGGINVTFANGSVIRVANGVSIGGGSSVHFGNSDVYVNGGFNSGSSGVTFGNGLLWIGSGTVTFSGTNTKGNGDVVINATTSLGGNQRLVMGQGRHAFRRLVVGGGGSARFGAGDFVLVSGLAVDGDSEVSLGAGDIVIGRHADGNGINLAGSARFFMGDGAFSTNGNIVTSGGSRLVFGVTPNHYIAGNMTIGGAVLFGRGRYTINGNFTNGTGGTTWPYTSPLTAITYGNTLEGVSVAGFDQAGIDVTFILAGTLNLGGGARSRLEAPIATQPGGAIAELLLSTASAAASNWNAGSANRFGGTLHLPKSALTMAGGNSTSGTRCMSLIAATITVSGGAATGSACSKMQDASASGAGTAIRLVG